MDLHAGGPVLGRRLPVTTTRAALIALPHSTLEAGDQNEENVSNVGSALERRDAAGFGVSLLCISIFFNSSIGVAETFARILAT